MHRKVDTLILGTGFVGRMAMHLFPGSLALHLGPAPFTPQQPNTEFLRASFFLHEPIPLFKTTPIEVTTSIDGVEATLSGIMAYKTKIGKADEDPTGWMKQFQFKTTGWSPYEWVPSPEPPEILDCDMVRMDFRDRGVTYRLRDQDSYVRVTYKRLISTIPLPSLLPRMFRDLPVTDMLRSQPIHIHSGIMDHEVKADRLNIVYVTDPGTPVYRQTQQGWRCRSESLEEFPRTEHGGKWKIVPGKVFEASPESAYKIERVLENLSQYGLHTVGRYGSWRSNELLHDSYQRLLALREAVSS